MKSFVVDEMGIRLDSVAMIMDMLGGAERIVVAIETATIVTQMESINRGNTRLASPNPSVRLRTQKPISNKDKFDRPY
jgi:hypothetical protein